MKQDIFMEAVHGRKGKNKTTFKAVLNKVLVSAVVLGTIAGMGTPALAAEITLKDTIDNTIYQDDSISVSSAITSLKNTIATINEMKANGAVSSSQIKTLANQLYSLESVAKGNVTSDVISVINKAESAIKGLSNATEAEVAIAVVKENLGIDTVTASNKSEAKPLSFSDVPADHWAYDAIMAMTSKELFGGTTTPVNGVGTFAPDKTMSRAEFITVVIRALYGDELTAMPKSEGDWYANAYTLATRHGILNEVDLDNGNLKKPMTRQEMSMVLIRAAAKNGEEPESLISTSQIADYDTVGTAYKDYVVYAYSMGMLCGTDSKGTFTPQGTLSRAQASTVLYRLVEPSSRQEVDFTAPTAPVTPPVTEAPQGQQKWVEGEAHSEPKVGDIVIKDGKEIVLKRGYGGIIGAGQDGVDVYTGTVINGVTAKEGMFSWFDGSEFRVDEITGQMYTGAQWVKIMRSQSPPNDLVGDYDGEPYGIWFKWDATFGAWDWLGPIIA